MLDEQQLRCVECYGRLNPELSCIQCGTRYERAPSGAPIMMTAADREGYRVLLDSERGAQMQAVYSQRRSPHWIRKLYPPDPVYVNPSAPPLPASRPGMHLWIGGAGLDLPGFVNIDVAAVPGVDVVANAARLPFPPSSFPLMSSWRGLLDVRHDQPVEMRGSKCLSTRASPPGTLIASASPSAMRNSMI